MFTFPAPFIILGTLVREVNNMCAAVSSGAKLVLSRGSPI